MSDAEIRAQGDKVRDLKAAKAGKDVITAEVKVLLDLKAKYKVRMEVITAEVKVLLDLMAKYTCAVHLCDT